MALPPSFDELIPADHTVRVVNDVINAINIEPLLKAYHVRGGSNYHPLLLLKVLVYGYVTNIYSSRKLAEACRWIFWPMLVLPHFGGEPKLCIFKSNK